MDWPDYWDEACASRKTCNVHSLQAEELPTPIKSIKLNVLYLRSVDLPTGPGTGGSSEFMVFFQIIECGSRRQDECLASQPACRR